MIAGGDVYVKAWDVGSILKFRNISGIFRIHLLSKRTMQYMVDKVAIARNALLINFQEVRELLNRVSRPKAQFVSWFESGKSGQILLRPQFRF
ncbi:hypothetical protein NPIL_312351 [Nephila pilipes]|uniref:Bro-N domain-containing protein n=1 Tax=Nephila pilipes TaxID=299642 RepID=A0A8X6NPN7_NEPPI|nr:hypothetical protein NPIL_312351 [Nephila pilipes]